MVSKIPTGDTFMYIIPVNNTSTSVKTKRFSCISYIIVDKSIIELACKL